MSSTGDEAIELALMAGLALDPWQQFVLRHAMGELEDGRWAAFMVALVVARQNGKGALLEALELAALFLFEDVRLIIHSAHQFDTALEAFGRLTELIMDTPELSKMVPKRGGLSRAHGQEGINLTNGKRIRFRTRTSGGGRGFSADLLILDEAMIISKEMYAALMPTLSARPNPQVWFTGSAVDEEVHEHGWVFSKIRELGVAGDPNLAFFEWSVDPERYRRDPLTATDPEAWAQANPALGIRIPQEFVATEQRSAPARQFSVERLSIGHWADTAEADGRVISHQIWSALADRKSQIADTPFFGVDVTPDRTRSSIAVAGTRSDGRWHVEIIENLDGTDWVLEMCSAIRKANPGSRFVIDTGSAAGTFLQEFKNARLRVVEIGSKEYGRACGEFYDTAVEGTLHYLPPQPELSDALAAATTRRLGDAWAWDRRNLTDISSLVAATLALWGAKQPKTVPRVVNLTLS